jgi:hypothetical protein
MFSVAFGSALAPGALTKPRPKWESQKFLHIVVVTEDDDAFRARMKLSDKVFGPMFLESKHFVDVEVWSKDRYFKENSVASDISRQLACGMVLIDRREEMTR